MYAGFTDGGDLVQLTISGNTSAAQVITSGTYELKINDSVVSSGAVSPGAGDELTFTPDSGQTAFTADISGGVPAFTSPVPIAGGTVTIASLAESPIGMEAPQAAALGDANGNYTFPADSVYDFDEYLISGAMTFESYYDDYPFRDDDNTEPFISASVSTSGKLSLILSAPNMTKLDQYYDVQEAHWNSFGDSIAFTPSDVKVMVLGAQELWETSPSPSSTFCLAKKKPGDPHDAGSGYVEYWYANKTALLTGTFTGVIEGNMCMYKWNILLKKGWNSVIVTTEADPGASGDFIITTASGFPDNTFRWEVYDN
ncbi:MAG: hypothetical protein LBK13_00325 [Spirochaetales bacterium]|nr:hypothetical protein [Spirochaetales bacterium]